MGKGILLIGAELLPYFLQVFDIEIDKVSFENYLHQLDNQDPVYVLDDVQTAPTKSELSYYGFRNLGLGRSQSIEIVKWMADHDKKENYRFIRISSREWKVPRTELAAFDFIHKQVPINLTGEETLSLGVNAPLDKALAKWFCDQYVGWIVPPATGRTAYPVPMPDQRFTLKLKPEFE